MPSAVDDLKQALALRPKLRVMISHGMYDTVTPYFATQYIIDHVPAFGENNRLELKLHAGGHMHYNIAQRVPNQGDCDEAVSGD